MIDNQELPIGFTMELADNLHDAFLYRKRDCGGSPFNNVPVTCRIGSFSQICRRG